MRALIPAAVIGGLFFVGSVDAGHIEPRLYDCTGQTIPCHFRNFEQPTVIEIGDNLPPEYDVVFDYIIPLWNAGQDEYALVVVPGLSLYGDNPIPASDPTYDCEEQLPVDIRRGRVGVCRDAQVCSGCQGYAFTDEGQYLPGTTWHSHTVSGLTHTRANILPPDPNAPCCFPAGSFAQNVCHEIGHTLGRNHFPISPCSQTEGGNFGSWTPDPDDFEAIVIGAHGGDCADVVPWMTGNPRIVDSADIAYVSNYFGEPSPPAPWQADYQNSGYVDSADNAIVANQFGRQC